MLLVVQSKTWIYTYSRIIFKLFAKIPRFLLGFTFRTYPIGFVGFAFFSIGGFWQGNENQLELNVLNWEVVVQQSCCNFVTEGFYINLFNTKNLRSFSGKMC